MNDGTSRVFNESDGASKERTGNFCPINEIGMPNLNVGSIELNLNDDNAVKVGQKLFQQLLNSGEIERITTSDEAREFGNNAKSSDARYNELIAAFNVILEEVIRQKKLTTSFKNTLDLHRIINLSTDPYERTAINLKPTKSIEHPKRTRKPRFDNGTSSNSNKLRSKSNSLNKCLSPSQIKLLQMVRKLDSQLSKYIEKMKHSDENNSTYEEDGEDEDEKDQISLPIETDGESSRRRQTKRFSIKTSSENDPMASALHESEVESTVTVSNENAPGNIILKRIFNDHQNKTKIKKRNVGELSQFLHADNNYGMEKEKFERYTTAATTDDDKKNGKNSDESDKFKLIPKIPKPTHIGSIGKHPSSRDYGEKTISISKSGISIPLRLVKQSDGTINLTLDRRNICQSRRCKPRPSN